MRPCTDKHAGAAESGAPRNNLVNAPHIPQGMTGFGFHTQCRVIRMWASEQISCIIMQAHTASALGTMPQSTLATQTMRCVCYAKLLAAHRISSAR